MVSTYFNEFDKFPAAWLRALYPGAEVDERSIADVGADELLGRKRAHFFAGIGGWEYALELAGWPADAPVWTGSCPCQPFSAAGKGLGEKDPRHLWPEFRRLIAICRPPVVFGEQVASKAGRLWLAGVRADLEALGYAVGAADLCAAGAGAPHIRQRLFWVAYATSGQEHTAAARGLHAESGERGNDGGVAYAGPFGVRGGGLGAVAGEASGVQGTDGERERVRSDAGSGGSAVRGLADRAGTRPQEAGCGDAREGREAVQSAERGGDSRLGYADEQGPQGRQRRGDGAGERAAGSPGVGAWDSARWLQCSDGKARRVEPGVCPLAHGIPGRVGQLRGYGNAIVPQVAAQFVSAFMEAVAVSVDIGSGCMRAVWSDRW